MTFTNTAKARNSEEGLEALCSLDCLVSTHSLVLQDPLPQQLSNGPSTKFATAKHQIPQIPSIRLLSTMPPRRSASAIPVFLFLGLILIFVPAMIFLLLFLKKRRQRARSGQSRTVSGDGMAGGFQAPIEMGNFRAPAPPPPAVKPIRSMSAGRNQPYNMQGMTKVDLGVPNQHQPYETHGHTKFPYTEPAYGKTAITSFSHQQSPTSPRYNLQSALDSEHSPASVGTAGERKTSISDAPRVKSQRVNPSQAHWIVEQSLHPPAVPRVEAGHYAAGHQHQQQSRWA